MLINNRRKEFGLERAVKRYNERQLDDNTFASITDPTECIICFKNNVLHWCYASILTYNDMYLYNVANQYSSIQH